MYYTFHLCRTINCKNIRTSVHIKVKPIFLDVKDHNQPKKKSTLVLRNRTLSFINYKISTKEVFKFFLGQESINHFKDHIFFFGFKLNSNENNKSLAVVVEMERHELSESISAL